MQAGWGHQCMMPSQLPTLQLHSPAADTAAAAMLLVCFCQQYQTCCIVDLSTRIVMQVVTLTIHPLHHPALCSPS